MTTPQGMGGFDINEWLEAHTNWQKDQQNIPLPPTDPWIAPFIVSGPSTGATGATGAFGADASGAGSTGSTGNTGATGSTGAAAAASNTVGSLSNRTRDNIQDFYAGQLAGNTWWEQLINFVGGTLGALAQPIIDFLNWLWDLVNPLVDGVRMALDDTILKPLARFLKWLFDSFGIAAETALKAIFDFLKWMWESFGNTVSTVLQPLFIWLGWVWRLFNHIEPNPVPAGFLSQPIATLFKWLHWFWDLFEGAVKSVLEPIFIWLNWVWRLFNHIEPNPVPEGFFSQPIATLFQWLHWLWDKFEGAVQTVLQPIFVWLNWVWRLFNHIEPNPVPEGFFSQPIATLFQWLHWLWDKFEGAVQTILQPLFVWLNWLWRLFANIEGPNPKPEGPGADVLVPIFEWLDWLFEKFGEAFSQTMQTIFNTIDYVFSILAPENIQEIFATLLTMITNAGGSLAEWLKTIPVVGDVLGLIQAITGMIPEGIAQGIGLVTYVLEQIPFIGPLISGLVGNDWVNPATGTNNTLPDLIAWARSQLRIDTVIPAGNLYGDIPKDLLAMLPIGHIGDSQPNLVSDQSFSSPDSFEAGGGWEWSPDTASASSGGSAKVTMDGTNKKLFSNLVEVAPNQKLFLSARVKWARQGAVPAPTVSIGLRGYTGSTVNFTNDVALLAVSWRSTSPTDPTSGAYTAGAGSGAANVTAALKDGWVTLSGEFTVPPKQVVNGMTQPSTDSMRMFLSCNNGTQGSVWFDEVILKKTSVLPQELVANLGPTLDTKLAGTDFKTLLAKIANKTGATITDVEVAVSNFLNGNSALNGSNIKLGNIQAAFISELVATWANTSDGVTRDDSNGKQLELLRQQYVAGTITLDQYTAAVKQFADQSASDLNNYTGNQAALTQTVSDLDTKVKKVAITVDATDKTVTTYATQIKDLGDIVTALQNATKQLQTTVGGTITDIKALQLNAGIPQSTLASPNASVGKTFILNTTPNVPVFVTAMDDFERAANAGSLGSNWTTPKVKDSDGTTLGTNGSDAYVTAPTYSAACPRFATAWIGSGKQSTTSNQRVSCVLVGSAGNPFSGRPGYNDLIARVATVSGVAEPLYGIVARFYGNGYVRVFVRNGAWETNAFVPALYPGTNIESLGYQFANWPTTGTKLLLEVSGSTVTVKAGTQSKSWDLSSFPASTLAPLGKGWGMGFGNGYADSLWPGTNYPQTAAPLIVWSAEDLV